MSSTLKNLNATTDYNGLWDGADSNEFTLDRAYDQDSGQDANINVDDLDLFFNIAGASQSRVIFNTQTPLGFGVSSSGVIFRLNGVAVSSDVGFFRVEDTAEEEILLITTSRSALSLPVIPFNSNVTDDEGAVS